MKNFLVSLLMVALFAAIALFGWACGRGEFMTATWSWIFLGTAALMQFPLGLRITWFYVGIPALLLAIVAWVFLDAWREWRGNRHESGYGDPWAYGEFARLFRMSREIWSSPI